MKKGLKNEKTSLMVKTQRKKKNYKKKLEYECMRVEEVFEVVGEEYKKISSCDNAKEMWDKLEVTYEGTNKVKETRINMLIHDYELFQMKEGESIEEMSLPTTWQTKVVPLKSHDLDKHSYDELRGGLIAFDKTHLKRGHEEKKKIVAFKTSIGESEDENEIEAVELEQEIAMVFNTMNGLMRRYMNTKKGRMSSRRTSRQCNEQEKNEGKCYECEKYGHIQAECRDLKRKSLRGFSKNKSFGSWSDEDSSKQEEIINLCFMTILENDMNKFTGCWTNKDVSDDDNKETTENFFMA
ncbi:uncharacterized protein [Nicotiana tomentosiformis]|uniref:uncharacterized protein n=1 Tax=Nicotiana tomentosiformis TaxID=4098 RepID=UPI00388C88AA